MSNILIAEFINIRYPTKEKFEKQLSPKFRNKLTYVARITSLVDTILFAIALVIGLLGIYSKINVSLSASWALLGAGAIGFPISFIRIVRFNMGLFSEKNKKDSPKTP